jgi:hypothetical protein
MFEDDFKSTNPIFRMTMFDNMLNDPISPLTAGNSINVFKDFLDAGTLD